ncbi:2-methylcitrate dehydratase [mine drainage metagenome]|jgi:2-methylcitrate dehydratase PrpD|uniref:2-methylcitrate dehydratase n=1 Tax=mine drainage metagenome TaxID=410659 RepID=A0A1J5R8W5_9ZZZZ
MSQQPPPVTATLAAYLVNASPEAVPAAVRLEAVRTFVNWVGCAVGGSRHAAVTTALAALSPFSGPARASVLGRSERVDPLLAALLNGISSHVFDFDDTHLRTVIHPAGPVLSALLAFAEHQAVRGDDFIHALVLGVEAECRIGNAVFPAHYDIGWHITGSAGVFGAAAAVGRLLELDEQRMAWALGLAATQPVGLREMFGSMTKSFHPGRAAQNGMTAALLAARGYTSSEQALEAPRGWLNVLSTSHDSTEITEGLGSSYEISTNSYKPFACGIVIHPVIDACLQLRKRDGFELDAVRAVRLRVHPLVLELTGKTEPRSGLEGKFSVFHAAAVALCEGDGGERQFSDRAVLDPSVVELRRRVSAQVDTTLEADAADVDIELADGRHLHLHVEHAIGSSHRPMSNADLEHKFLGLGEDVLGEARTRRLLDACWNVEHVEDIAAIATAART